ncbi:MAG TPA: alanine--glyoxylate aminotransferase family protein [Acidobacteriota bacterium]|nr:alanine--glyoxylate aminotransferase family protein [Acidobacteriota bacterium]
MATTFHPPQRVLLGPGPSNIEPRILQAMIAPILGYLDPVYLECMNEIQKQLRTVFETENRVTFSVSGTGGAGMEACISNLVEQGDEVIVCVNGFFGQRAAELVERWGGKVRRVEAEWGKPLDMQELRDVFRRSSARLVFMVHAETSTGMRQPIEDLKSLRDIREAILIVDSVTSLGAHPMGIDRNGIDACYSCSQKGIGAPPGLSPVTFSERALEKIRSRRQRPGSWYLDIQLIDKYWGPEHIYHHTSPALMNYALREALAIILEEGLERRWQRHEENSRLLVAGLEKMGLKMLVAPEHRLWTLNTVRIPEGIDDARVRGRLLNEHNIEIGAGFGSLKGKIWRIGLMGSGSTENNVLLLLSALGRVLLEEGYKA